MRRAPKRPRKVVRDWGSKLILGARKDYLPVARDQGALVGWGALLSLVGPPGDPEADAACAALRLLLVGRGRSQRWAAALAEVPADRGSVLALAEVVRNYERLATAGHFHPLSRATSPDLAAVVRGMLRVSRAPDPYLREVGKMWCEHPNMVFAESTMKQLGGKLRGLGLAGGPASRDTMQDEELEAIRVVG